MLVICICNIIYANVIINVKNIYITVVNNVSDVNYFSIADNVSIVKYLDLPIKKKYLQEKKKLIGLGMDIP